jgi:cobyrinic acid a,c-diamide synthase
MTGILPAEAVMRKQSLTLGYRTVECTRRCILGEVGVTTRGHEFHYSTLIAKGPLQYACALSDAGGSIKKQDGLTRDNVLALYTHLHFAGRPQIGTALVEAARQSTVRMFMNAG